MAFAEASSDTSVRTYVAWPPPDSTCSTVSRPAASPYSATTTFAPSLAKSRDATRPIPPPAPVMIATLSCSRTLASLDLLAVLGSRLRRRPGMVLVLPAREETALDDVGGPT